MGRNAVNGMQMRSFLFSFLAWLVLPLTVGYFTLLFLVQVAECGYVLGTGRWCSPFLSFSYVVHIVNHSCHNSDARHTQ